MQFSIFVHDVERRARLSRAHAYVGLMWGRTDSSERGKVGNCCCMCKVLCATQSAQSVDPCLLANRLTIDNRNTVGPCQLMAWPRRGDCGPRDLAVISLLSLHSFVDCRVPRESRAIFVVGSLSSLFQTNDPPSDSYS